MLFRHFNHSSPVGINIPNTISMRLYNW